MMYVKTKLGMSKIHGIGIFADEFIPKGTVVWKFVSGFDQAFTREQILNLPKQAQEYLSTYTYLSKKSNLYIFPADNARHFNHLSDNNNVKSEYEDNEQEVVAYAIKDIQVDEEMTEDYRIIEEWDGVSSDKKNFNYE